MRSMSTLETVNYRRDAKKESKEFPRNELISTYSYRHGCPRTRCHTRLTLTIPLPFSFANFSSITVSSAHLLPYRCSTRLARARISTISTVQCTQREQRDTPHVRRNRVSWNIYRRGTLYRWICHAGNDNVVYRVVGTLALENSTYFGHLAKRKMFFVSRAPMCGFSREMKIIIKDGKLRFRDFWKIVKMYNVCITISLSFV